MKHTPRIRCFALALLAALILPTDVGLSAPFHYEPNENVVFAVDDAPQDYGSAPIYRVEHIEMDVSQVALMMGYPLEAYERADREGGGFWYTHPNAYISVEHQRGIVWAEKETGGRAYQIISHFFTENTYEVYADRILDASELGFMSPSDAGRIAVNALKSLGELEYELVIEIYPLHAGDMQREANAALAEYMASLDDDEEPDEGMMEYLTPPDFTEEDERYFIFIRFADRKVPLTADYRWLNLRYVPGAFALFLIGKDGLQLMRCNAPFYRSGESIASGAAMSSLVEAADLFASFYEDVVMNPMTITQVRMEYFALPYNRNEAQAEMRPLWLFGIDYGDESEEFIYWKYIDAYTGRVYNFD